MYVYFDQPALGFASQSMHGHEYVTDQTSITSPP